MAWSDQEGWLGREGTLKVGQNSLGEKDRRSPSPEGGRHCDLGTGELLNMAGVKGTGKW